MDSQINIDVNNLCRTCLSSTLNLRSLSAPISDSRTIFEALSNVLNKDIMISELLPYKICEECESCLYQYDNFKQKCLENEEVIKNWFISNSTDKSEDSCCSEDVSLHITIPYQCAICLEKFMNIIDLQDHYANVHVDKSDKVEIFYTQERNPVWVAALKQESSEESSSEEESSDGVSDSENHLTTQTLYNFDTIVESNECVTKETTEAESVEVLKCEDIVKVEQQEDIVHNEVNNSKSNEINEIVENKLMEEKFEVPIIEYHCDICDTVFKTVRAIKIHTKRKHGYSILDNKVNPDEQEYVEDVPLQCSMCMRKFNKKACLERHLKKHKEDLNNVYTCNFCKREFQRKAHLENHITTLHMKQKVGDDSLDCLLKKHKCKHCGKCFQHLTTLKDHLRVHTGEKPFLCSTCGRGFSQKTNLKEHMRRHEGLKPYKCAVCGQGFVSKGELTSHQRTHTGAHPFVCDICSNGFTTSSSLAKHKRIHVGDKRFSCDLCPMKFTASSTLKNHRRTHTGEKPFSCSHCDKAFVQRHDLVAHTRCHTGERPFICAVCGQAFRQNSALRTHTKIHKETPVQNLQLSRNLNNNGNALLQQNVCLRQLHLS